MNEVLKTIRERRSIRSYKPEQIADEELRAILEAGAYAPSARNEQACKFVVIQNGKTMERFLSLTEKVLPAGGSPFYGAPTLVLVFADKNAIAPTCDASLAIENLFLAAASMGIGSCWIYCVIDIFGTAEGKAFQKEIGVPENYKVVGSAVLGYPNESPKAKPRRSDTVIRL